MRKALFSLVFGLVLAVAPVYAQHHGGSNGGGHESHGNNNHAQQGNNHTQAQPRGNNQPHGGYRPEGRPGFQGRPGYRSSSEARTHWDGRRFDRGYYAAHWGPAHPFYWGRAGWFGPRWAVGSRFWFGGVWFSVIDPIPYYWYNDQVTVIYDEDCGCYYAVDPGYPGVRIHIGVAF